MKFYQSSLLKQFSNLSSLFTTKKSGNLAFHVGDDKERVILNHKELAKTLSYELRTLVHMKQIHSNRVHRVDENDNFENPQSCDALITDRKNTPLMVVVADCSPLLFYDAKQETIAVAHAGRAGAFSNIVQNVCESFKNDFHSDMRDIYVSVGPSIKECCYEVGREIYDEAKDLNLEYALKQQNNSYYLNISKILKTQLLAAGVEEKNIEFSDECSCCQSQKYFSYRAKKVTGRFAGVICLH
jgi:polyphenol oxidase